MPVIKRQWNVGEHGRLAPAEGTHGFDPASNTWPWQGIEIPGRHEFEVLETKDVNDDDWLSLRFEYQGEAIWVSSRVVEFVPPHEWRLGDRARIRDCSVDARTWAFGVLPVGYEFTVKSMLRPYLLCFEHDSHPAILSVEYAEFVGPHNCHCPTATLVVLGCQCGGI